MGYRRILAGTDGSETATASVRTAARLAKRFRSDLLVVSAYEPPAFPAERAQHALDLAAAAARGEGAGRTPRSCWDRSPRCSWTAPGVAVSS